MPEGQEERSFNPEPIIAALLARHVTFVVIGGLAAQYHGSPMLTYGIDVTPELSEANLQRLSDALRDLDARGRHPDSPEGLLFAYDATSLAAAVCWHLTTRHGDLDLSFMPAGTRGYDDLAAGAVTITIHCIPFPVASLADVVRSKDAADRPKDHRALPVLRELLAQQRETARQPKQPTQRQEPEQRRRRGGAPAARPGQPAGGGRASSR